MFKKATVLCSYVYICVHPLQLLQQLTDVCRSWNECYSIWFCIWQVLLRNCAWV